MAKYAYWPLRQLADGTFFQQVREAAHWGELCPEGQGRLRKIRLATLIAVSSYILSAIFKVMKSIRTIILLSTFIVFLLILGFSVFPKKNPRMLEKQLLDTELTEITIGNSKLYTEKALNESEWSRGLSGRTELKSNNGMLFIFPNSETKIFWMKDTIIPLDIIWVANNKVVGIDHMFPELNTPLSLLERYISPLPVDKVIETNLNWTTENSIKIGDKISY